MSARRPSKARDRSVREAQERARLHAARTEWHASRIRRRVRDNIIVGIVGGVIVAGAFVSQAVHAQVAPPAPAPSPSPTSTAEPTPEAPAVETPTPTPAP